MELKVELKICEACGRHFFRPGTQHAPYCPECSGLLQRFPPPVTTKTRGARSLKSLQLAALLDVFALKHFHARY